MLFRCGVDLAKKMFLIVFRQQEEEAKSQHSLVNQLTVGLTLQEENDKIPEFKCF